jgi:hypothetical protein
MKSPRSNVHGRLRSSARCSQPAELRQSELGDLLVVMTMTHLLLPLRNGDRWCAKMMSHLVDGVLLLRQALKLLTEMSLLRGDLKIKTLKATPGNVSSAEKDLDLVIAVRLQHLVLAATSLHLVARSRVEEIATALARLGVIVTAQVLLVVTAIVIVQVHHLEVTAQALLEVIETAIVIAQVHLVATVTAQARLVVTVIVIETAQARLEVIETAQVHLEVIETDQVHLVVTVIVIVTAQALLEVIATAQVRLVVTVIVPVLSAEIVIVTATALDHSEDQGQEEIALDQTGEATLIARRTVMRLVARVGLVHKAVGLNRESGGARSEDFFL